MSQKPHFPIGVPQKDGSPSGQPRPRQFATRTTSFSKPRELQKITGKRARTEPAAPATPLTDTEEDDTQDNGPPKRPVVDFDEIYSDYVAEFGSDPDSDSGVENNCNDDLSDSDFIAVAEDFDSQTAARKAIDDRINSIVGSRSTYSTGDGIQEV